MEIRPAQSSDIRAITDIYNQVVKTSSAIYRDDPTSVEERLEWFQTLTAKGYPLLVVEDRGEVLGFASYSDFRPWPGYRYTVEGTIHLREDARRRGIGGKLLEALIQHAREAGKHMMMAGVDSENVASRRFLEKIGAEQVGHLHEVGFKFGRYLDLVLYQIRLSRNDQRPDR
jgi:phosphinothricin acetyltransferase